MTCTCPTCGQPLPNDKAVLAAETVADTRRTINIAGLTEKQAELLMFLDAEQRAGRSPSFKEMAEHMGLATKSSIFRLLNGLEERGRIRRLPHRARSVEVVRRVVA